MFLFPPKQLLLKVGREGKNQGLSQRPRNVYFREKKEAMLHSQLLSLSSLALDIVSLSSCP